MSLATSIVKFIGEFGISAAKSKFGTGKAKGLGSLTDEQLGQGLNKYQAKKAEKKIGHSPADSYPEAKPRSW